MIVVRPLRPTDNAAAAAVVRTVMPEFGCVGPGFSIEDPEMDDLYATYSLPRSGFFVAEDQGPEAQTSASAGAGPGGTAPRLLAVAGFAPLVGGPPDVCELRKMYGLSEARGLGLGHRLLDHCLTGARAAGFRTMYLETVTGMHQAADFYLRHGFTYIDGPMGNTGHGGCDRFMTLKLVDY